MYKQLKVFKGLCFYWVINSLMSWLVCIFKLRHNVIVLNNVSYSIFNNIVKVSASIAKDKNTFRSVHPLSLEFISFTEWRVYTQLSHEVIKWSFVLLLGH